MTPHVLYRFYAADDTLLYVGLTINPSRRFERHRGDKSWWNDVKCIEMEHFPTLEALRIAERNLIETAKPKHNIRMNSGVTRTQASPPPFAKGRRGIALDSVYAFGMQDGSCPIGIVTELDEEGLTFIRYRWLIGIFDSPDEWIPFDEIRRWCKAELLPDEEKVERGHPSDRIVFDMGPLGDFQTEWLQKHKGEE